MMKLKLNEDFSLYEGVSVEKGYVKFNFDSDNIDNDTLFLTQDSSLHTLYDDYEYFAAYTYNKSNKNYNGDAKIIRHFLKSPDNVFSAEVENFVDNGVLRFDSVCSCGTFDIIISPESSMSPSLVNSVIEPTILSYGGKLPVTIRLIKNCYENIRFNEDKVRTLLRNLHWAESKIEEEIRFTKTKFQQLKEEGNLFEIKRFLPAEIRKGFENYLIFRDDADKEMYKAIIGGKVLLFDDFVTSRATIEEMMRYLNAINPNTKLSIFVLVDQRQ